MWLECVAGVNWEFQFAQIVHIIWFNLNISSQYYIIKLSLHPSRSLQPV